MEVTQLHVCSVPSESRTGGFVYRVSVLHDDCAREVLLLLLYLEEETGSELCPKPQQWGQHFNEGLFSSKDCSFHYVTLLPT